MSAAMQQRRLAEARTDYFVFSPVRGRSRAKTFKLVPASSACISMGMQNTNPAPPFIADEAALLVWAKTALPGARAAYHVGHLACDRSPEMSTLSATVRAGLNSTAHRVMALVEQRRVIAVQQRIADGRIAYLVVAIPRPRPSRARFATTVLGTDGAPAPAIPQSNQEVA